MSKEFLLEIGTEEIPAWMIAGACQSLKELLEGELKGAGVLEGPGIETLATPRRLVAYARRLGEREADRVERVVGPPKTVAFDASGKPTRAAESFAAKQGVSVVRLELVETPKGSYVSAVSRRKGRATREILETILPGVIGRVSFPRTMYWGSAQGMRFIRPIRWLLALWGGRPLRVEVAGVRGGAVSYGHRILANKQVRVRGVEDYRGRLRKAYVLADPRERRAKIERECERLLKKERLCRRADNELMETLVNLVEHPSVILGSFDIEFLALPEEVLTTVMRHHQKYLSVEDRKGRLARHFLAVIDLDRDRTGEIRRNHERVLAARFRDAQFFWETDQKISLSDRTKLLEEVVFHSKVGTYGGKVRRVVRLARWLAVNATSDGRRADSKAAEQAARLCKSDLTTEMVGEFPELQGIIGGLYARRQGHAERTARAIYEHYRPGGAGDRFPESLEGCALGIADKLDTVVSCFAADLAPTGSSDPLGLRRAGTGIIRTLLERHLRLSLRRAIEESVATLRESGPSAGGPSDLATSVETFLIERARYLFRDVRLFPYDEVSAVLAAGADDLVDAAARLEALRQVRPSADFEPIAAAFKRIRNILEQAGKVAGHGEKPVEEGLLEGGAERELYERFARLQPKVASLRGKHQYREALREIASLRPQVDTFFDKVLVMADDQKLRENRLALLARMLREFSTIADFSEIVVTPKTKE